MTSTPVFVDASGRRARVVLGVCWVLAAAFGAYVLLVVAALFLPQGALSLSVPGIGPVLPKNGAPPLTTSSGGTGAPESVLSPSPRATPSPSRTPAQQVTRRPSPRPVTSPSARPTGVPTRRPTARPSATAVPTPVRGTGKPSARPTPRPHPSKTPPPHP